MLPSLLFVAASAYDVALDSLIVALSAKKSKPEPIYVYGRDKAFPEDLKADDTQHLAVNIKAVNAANKKEKIQPAQIALLLKMKEEQRLPAGMPRIQQFELEPIDDIMGVILSFGHKNFKAVAGKYEMSILVADSKIEKPLIHPLGDITLNFSEPIPVIDIALKDRRVYALKSEQEYHPAEPIFHKFREPEKRPPYVVSLIFLILSCAFPLAVFFAGLGVLRVNYSYLPTGKGRLFSIAFMTLLLICALILACFFLFLNIVETAQLLAPVFLAAILVGHQSLCATKDARKLGAAKEAKKH